LNVDVGFNNCHMSDMTDHLPQWPWPALVILVFLLYTISITSETCGAIKYTIDYMKFEEQ